MAKRETVEEARRANRQARRLRVSASRARQKGEQRAGAYVSRRRDDPAAAGDGRDGHEANGDGEDGGE